MRGRGFTLIEIVIAIFVAAVMFAIGYNAINQALLDRERINIAQARLTEVQRGMRVVAQDFMQIIARPSRDTSGNGEMAPAVASSTRDNILLTFSRAGWSNPAGVQRPAEQRVRYRFVDGSLVRESWASMDPMLNPDPFRRVLLTKVTSVQVRFLDPSSREWRTEWPAVAPTGVISPAMIDPVMRGRPIAIEFTVVLEDWGRLQRLFEIPT